MSLPHPKDFGFYSDLDAVLLTSQAIVGFLNRLPKRNRHCVEFGAWDGLVGSNSRDLILNEGYSAILIEGNPDRYNDLKKNYADKPEVIPINQFVGFSANDGLDSILKKTKIPRDFDFLTIDIDGNDYHVWQAVAEYRPKLVNIEFNPTIPPEVSFIQAADPSVSQGCSLAALVELCKRKKYELIAVLGVNAFFVTAELFPLFGLSNNHLETLWTKRDCVTYFFSGYDGRVFLRGCCKGPWQGIEFQESQVQVLPVFLQKYPWRRGHYILYLSLKRPLTMMKKIFCRLMGLNRKAIPR